MLRALGVIDANKGEAQLQLRWELRHRRWRCHNGDPGAGRAKERTTSRAQYEISAVPSRPNYDNAP
jgi:hypothetical protein